MPTQATYPLDTLRLRLAVDPGSRSVRGAAAALMREGSHGAFFRGLGASMLGALRCTRLASWRAGSKHVGCPAHALSVPEHRFLWPDRLWRAQLRKGALDNCVQGGKRRLTLAWHLHKQKNSGLAGSGCERLCSKGTSRVHSIKGPSCALVLGQNEHWTMQRLSFAGNGRSISATFRVYCLSLCAISAGIAPYMALELAVFDLMPPDLAPFARGFSSALLATTLCYPLDTVRYDTHRDLDLWCLISRLLAVDDIRMNCGRQGVDRPGPICVGLGAQAPDTAAERGRHRPAGYGGTDPAPRWGPRPVQGFPAQCAQNLPNKGAQLCPLSCMKPPSVNVVWLCAAQKM